MASEAAKLLDELMGRNRNAAASEDRRDVRWDDPEVCKFFLCDFCPHDLFVNTRADLGVCEKLHDDGLKKAYQKSSRFGRMGYDDEYLRFLQELLTDVERRIKKGQSRLHLNNAQASMNAGPQAQREEKVEMLSERINDLVQQAEELGCEGNVEQAQGVLKLCEKLKEERMQLENSSMNLLSQPKEMEVCDVCGAFLVVNDAQQRVDEHLMGKQHMGYAKLRVTVDDLKKKLRGENDAERQERLNKEREERLKEREERQKKDKERELEMEKEREERRKRRKEEEEAKRKKKSRSRSRSRRSRSRDRHRRSKDRRSRSRDKHSRNSSRDRHRSKRSHRSRSRDRKSSRDDRRSRDKDRRSRDKKSSRDRDRSSRDRDRSSRDQDRSSKDRSRSNRDKERSSRDKENKDGEKASKDREGKSNENLHEEAGSNNEEGRQIENKQENDAVGDEERGMEVETADPVENVDMTNRESEQQEAEESEKQSEALEHAVSDVGKAEDESEPPTEEAMQN